MKGGGSQKRDRAFPEGNVSLPVTSLTWISQVKVIKGRCHGAIICVAKHQLFHDVAYILPCRNRCVSQNIQVNTLSTEGHFCPQNKATVMRNKSHIRPCLTTRLCFSETKSWKEISVLFISVKNVFLSTGNIW